MSFDESAVALFHSPFIKDYLHWALCSEGQKALREQRDIKEGRVPRSATDLQVQRRNGEG
ncbi:hypothetical protein [Pseudomonas sp.]|uniref:hypothetical protein n=1 Tax=Pseudomonas sp. TaxID=306 RepID=UPI0028ABEFC7|nr:hypothetical protein [Pseudomonas sp.]